MTVHGFRFRTRVATVDRCHSVGLVVALTACLCVSRAAAASVPKNTAAPFAVGSSEHVTYESTNVRAESMLEAYRAAMETPAAATVTSARGALVINAAFDDSITNDRNAMAIEAAITDVIALYESLFNDPMTISILFRYATTLADGVTPLASGALSESEALIYEIPWDTYVNSLVADATTANDSAANATLPGTALSTDVATSSADGRAAGLNTPPALLANGTVGAGGPYDGIVTLNSSRPFKFTRPPAIGMFDALRTVEHEVDEVLGLGSNIARREDVRPQDLFSWSAAGVRNLTSSGSRFFSIDGGITEIVGFNQDPSGDLGDWLSGPCPQTNPYVQNAFGCADQVSDVMPTSPEGINLDVIGYDLIGGPTPGTCGDADANGVVSVTDGVQVLRAAADLSSMCTPARCDVDGNGEITVSDGVAVLRAAAGLSTHDACPPPP
jgi:hypothetical protein